MTTKCRIADIGTKVSKFEADEKVVSNDEFSSEEESKEEEEEQDEENDKKRKSDDERDEDDSDKPSKKAKTEEEPAEPSTIFVGSLAWSVDDDRLRSFFSEIGEITGARVLTHSDSGRSKGYGYVDFASPADAKKAVEEMHQKELDGRNINVDLSHPRPARENKGNDRSGNKGDSLSPESNTLFIANLSFDTTRDDLFNTFGEYGTVNSVRIPTNPDTGKPRGFGYIEMDSVDNAKAALQALNGENIAGRNVRLDYTSTRDNDNGGSRGFGGGRGGRGGRGGFGGRGGRGGFGGNRGGRGGFGGRGGRGGFGGRGGSSRGREGGFQGRKTTF